MKFVEPFEIFQKILKSNSSKQDCLLGLDVGHRFVGLAVSDTFHKIASPVSVLVRKKTNIDSMAKDFQTLVSRLSLAGFVVGYPFSLHGQHSVEAVQVRLFMEELRKTGKLDGLSYTYWDENYTSKCVEALLYPLNLHPIEHKTITDKFAAVGILQKGALRDGFIISSHLGPFDKSNKCMKYMGKRNGDPTRDKFSFILEKGYLDHMNRKLKSEEQLKESSTSK